MKVDLITQMATASCGRDKTVTGPVTKEVQTAWYPALEAQAEEAALGGSAYLMADV